MSTAFYPLGMRTMPAGGRSNATLPGQYLSWKGTGPLSNPVGTAPSHIRPLTNNDKGNVFLSGNFPSRTYNNVRVFIPRPLKQYRKGRVVPSTPIVPDSTNPITNNEIDLINYNTHRFVKSSKGTSLGGGFGGSGLLNELQDKPGAFIVKQNNIDELNNIRQLDNNCKTCEGVGIISSYYPNNRYLTDNPEPETQTPKFCCNEEFKARKRVIYASTNLKKNYYTTSKQYLQNRCKTYEQKAFNFQQYNKLDDTLLVNNGITAKELAIAKPGGPLSTFNTYAANCFPNAEIYEATEIALVNRLLASLLNHDIITQQQVDEFKSLNKITFEVLFNFLNGLPEETAAAAIAEYTIFLNNPYWGVPFAGPSNPAGCKLTVYKPNNYQFAKQGAVSSSTRLLKLNVDTISTNAASINRKNNTGIQLVTANELYRGDDNNVSNYFKNKSQERCTAPPAALIQGVYTYHNKKVCHYQKQLPEYQVPISQPSPYRYYIRPVFRTNHFSQSPNTYNTPGRSVSA
jgi:hypothetical protein